MNAYKKLMTFSKTATESLDYFKRLWILKYGTGSSIRVAIQGFDVL